MQQPAGFYNLMLYRREGTIHLLLSMAESPVFCRCSLGHMIDAVP